MSMYVSPSVYESFGAPLGCQKSRVVFPITTSWACRFPVGMTLMPSSDDEAPVTASVTFLWYWILPGPTSSVTFTLDRLFGPFGIGVMLPVRSITTGAVEV